MKIMTKKFKYCIIITAILMLFAVKIYAVGPGDGTTGNSWKITTSHIGSLVNFWCEWIYIHFGQGVDAKIKAGEGAGSGIIYIDKTEGKSNDVEAYGYGSYQFDLKKHMVGYLYYLKDHANYNSQTDITKTPEEYFTETGHYAEPPNLNFKDACKYVADKLMVTAYSKDTVNEYLNRLLAFIETHISADIVKTCQSDYWYRVYAQRAYGVLTGSLGFRTSGADMRKVHGALLSIMEDRYRDKNLKNKPRMQLSVEKGDLWPFLVYTETNDNGAHTLWQWTSSYMRGKQEITETHKTDWKKMLTGAYQYMVYYEYKVDDEADAVIDKRNIYNGVKAEMFREEYQTLFNEALPELRGKDLDDFYQRIRRIRRYYKKSSDNGGGVFGEEELYDISSDITYSRAIDKLSAKINGEFRDVFKGLDSDYIARTYLMAKNIADTTRLIEQNAQYDIGSNIVNRTPGGYGEQVLLSDLQLITLERGSDNKFSLDADKDGLIDGRELGNEDGTYKPLKISGFIKKMLKAEAGDSYSSATDLDYMYNMYKANIKAAATAADNAENRGNIVTEGRDKEKFIQTQHDIRVVGDDIYVDVMAYKSNPILKDTDFDGVWDGYGEDDETHKNQYRDELPLDNTIAGKITMTNGNDLDVSTHMDYRYFFMDKYNYYDELAVMSLILSNAVYGKNESNLSNLYTINNKIGLNLAYRDVSESIRLDKYPERKKQAYKYKTKYAIGNKAIEYSKDNSATNMIKKRVIPIIIPGMYEDSDAKSYSEIGPVDWIEESKNGNEKCGEEIHNVMSYEIYAELILNDIDEYERNSHDNIPGDKSEEEKKVYWVMGYKEGGAIANILASKLIDQAKDVYAYTFASPMTLYNNEEHSGYSRTGYLARYDSIFNVVNQVDAYCFVMPQSLGFSRYGMTCFGGNGVYNPVTNRFETDPLSVTRILEELEKMYEDKEKGTRNKTYEKALYPASSNNYYVGFYNVFMRLMGAIDKDRNNKTNSEWNFDKIYKEYGNIKELSSFINAIKTNHDKIKRAGQEDVYYNIAKNMNNADIMNVVNLHDNRKVKVATGSDLYGRYPNYHALNNIDINNPVPSIFQDAEVWSQFRYGITYNEDVNDTIDHPNDTDKEENKKRKVRKFVNSWPTEIRNQYYQLKSENKQLNTQITNINKNHNLSSQQKSQLKAPLNAQIQANKQAMDNIVATYNIYFYGTFWESACGVTSAAIVLSYLSDKQITPIDIRDRLENKTPTPEDYRPGSSGTSHATIKNIAELYGYQCDSPMVYESPRDNESESDKRARESRNSVKVVNVVKELLRGNPVIAICKKGEFTAGGHYIVIAGIDTNQVNDIKRQKGIATISDATLKETKWNEAINNLTYNELSNLRIYVLDPRYKHQAHPGRGKQATITHAWNINTFSYGGAGNPEKFWIYKKGNNAINLGTGVSETDLFDFNRVKYPNDYIEYFDPQGPDDTDEFCNSGGSPLPVGSFGKLDGQKWR